MFKKFKKNLDNKKARRIWNISLIFIIISFISTLFFTYTLYLLKNVENLIRMLVIIGCYLISIGFLIKGMNLISKPKKKKRTSFFILIVIWIIIQLFLGYEIKNIYDPISNINKSKITFTSELIVLKDSKIDDIDDIDDINKNKIGIIKKEYSIEDYTLASEIIKKNSLKSSNTIKEYDDYFNMINDLYEKKLEAIIVPDNYSIMFASYEKFSDIKNQVKSIVSESKEFKKASTDSSSSKLVSKEPFTILLMGVDSEKDGLDKNAAFNGDSLMLITFNPKTLTATTLSIPRDTYVPIMCFKNHKENKITHASWYGADCMIKTIENFTGLNIDYYVKMNFKGVVNLVDALGGIDIDVPIEFCEQNSDRQFGDKEICLKKGYQHLDGEEALALSRHRKTLANGDIGRGLHQQLVIQGMTKKLSKIDSINKFNKILNSITKNMDTDLSTDQIISFYNVGKDILLKGDSVDKSNLVNIQKLFLEGYGKLIYDDSFKMNLYEYIYYKNSLNAVVDAMKINLGIKKAELIKEFSFDVNTIYEETIIGKNKIDSKKMSTLSNLVGKTKSYATSYCNNNKLKCSFITIDEDNPLYNSKYDNNEIINQSVRSGTDIEKINSIVFKIIEKKTITSNDTKSSDKSNTNSTTKKSTDTELDNKTTESIKDDDTSKNSTDNNSDESNTTEGEKPGPTEG